MAALGRHFLLDWSIFILGLLLSAFGLVLVYSATWRAGNSPGFYASDIFIKQCVALVIALLVFHFARRIKWGLKPSSWVWFYVPVIGLLILVVFVGHASGTESQRWIDLGIFKLQPSEPAKLAWVMLLAWLFSVNQAYLRRNYFIALFLMLSMVGLMMAQPDLGTSMVFVFAFGLMAWLAPIPRKVIWATLLVCSLAALPFLRAYQVNRVLALFGKQRMTVVRNGEVADPRIEVPLNRAERALPGKNVEIGDVVLMRADPQGVSYQLNQGLIALGSGGLTGKGFLRGTQSKGNFIPEVESDFIYTLAGEEFGFVGCFFLVLLYFLLIARMLVLARSSHTIYERYICYGASAVLLFHVFVNIGMTVKLVPIAGVPLPFISQGGSSLISFWAMLAVLESIYEKSQGEYLHLRRRN